MSSATAAEERGRALSEASALMLGFTERTGLGSERPAHRYLWTDAFAVCNLLALARATGDAGYRELALGLVDQVHRVLGRHRADDARTSWISGLSEVEGERHPTLGGLRIGKRLPERPLAVPFDAELEWDRDGQYFHYLTRWMHALDQVARETGQPLFNTWARELAEAAHRSFTSGPHGNRRMAWKMSVDLSRPLVPAMGQHDPLDGLITCLQLQATAAVLPGAPREPTLVAAIDEFAALTRASELATDDSLGLGGLLCDACRVAQLMRVGVSMAGELIAPLLAAASTGFSQYARHYDPRRPAEQRLAFRELGLAIGIAALGRTAAELRRMRPEHHRGALAQVDELQRYTAIGRAIEAFWRAPAPRTARTWLEHRDINEVMLATCLVPEGVLALHALR